MSLKRRTKCCVAAQSDGGWSSSLFHTLQRGERGHLLQPGTRRGGDMLLLPRELQSHVLITRRHLSFFIFAERHFKKSNPDVTTCVSLLNWGLCM